MSAPLAELAPRFRFNEQLLQVVTDGMTDATWSSRPPGGGNNAHWILGHVVASRRLVARMAGAKLDQEKWEAAFAMGADPDEHADSMAPVAELLGAMQAAGESISERFAVMTSDDVNADSPRPFPDGTTTIGGAIHFLYMHEAYHVGQIGLLRRMGGLAGFA